MMKRIWCYCAIDISINMAWFIWSSQHCSTTLAPLLLQPLPFEHNEQNDGLSHAYPVLTPT